MCSLIELYKVAADHADHVYVVPEHEQDEPEEESEEEDLVSDAESKSKIVKELVTKVNKVTNANKQDAHMAGIKVEEFKEVDTLNDVIDVAYNLLETLMAEFAEEHEKKDSDNSSDSDSSSDSDKSSSESESESDSSSDSSSSTDSDSSSDSESSKSS